MSDWVSDLKKFRYSEFVVSSQFPKLADETYLTDIDEMKVRYWVNSIGDTFRIANPSVRLKITSGKRSKPLNDAVGGVSTSDHLVCCAVDYYSPDMDIHEIFTRMINLGVPYRQLILYPKKRFIHHSINVPDRDYLKEVLIKL